MKPPSPTLTVCAIEEFEGLLALVDADRVDASLVLLTVVTAVTLTTIRRCANTTGAENLAPPEWHIIKLDISAITDPGECQKVVSGPKARRSIDHTVGS